MVKGALTFPYLLGVSAGAGRPTCRPRWASCLVTLVGSAAVLLSASAARGTQIPYQGGPVIANVKVVQVLYGTGTYLSKVDNSTGPQNMANFYSAITSGPYMDLLLEYGTPTTAIGKGTFFGTVLITPSAPNSGTTLTDAQIGRELASQIGNNHLPQPDANTLYMVHFPQGIVPNSSTGDAWHDTWPHSPFNIYFAVMPYTDNFDTQTGNASHEFAEAITDPAVGLAGTDPTVCPLLGWTSGSGGAEIADQCHGYATTIVGSSSEPYTVTDLWSNQLSPNQLNPCVAPPLAIQNDYSLSVASCFGSVTPGHSNTYTVTSRQTIGSDPAAVGLINLSYELLPGISGVTASFNPQQISAGGSSTLTFSADASVVPDGDVYHATTFSVTGASASSGSQAARAKLLITPDFSISAPTNVTVTQGQSSAPITISTTTGTGVAQTVTLSASNLPSGVSASFSPKTVTAGKTSILTLAADLNATSGTATITITGAGSSNVSHSVTSLLNVLNYRPPVIPPVNRVVVPPLIPRRLSATGTATLTSAAPAGGVTLNLTSSNPSAASVPATASVPAGATVSQTFTITAGNVSAPTQVTITASSSAGGASSTLTVSVPSVSIAWVKPSGVTWGPPNTLTVGGYAANGTGTVQMVWRDVTANGGWNVLAYQATPAVDTTWSNSIPTSNYCHTYQVYANYAGATSSIFTYTGVSSGYCTEAAKVVWMQPQASAGFGPPGSLVIGGTASGAPSGTQVYMYWRDLTAGTGWAQAPYAPLPGSNTYWYNDIDNANYSHQYSVYVKYDAISTAPCTYAGNGSITWCP